MVARWVTIPDNGGRPLLDHDKSWVAVARSQLDFRVQYQWVKLFEAKHKGDYQKQMCLGEGARGENIPYPKNLIKVANLEILEIKDDTSSVREMENPTVDAAVRAMDPATKGKA
ncbi:hypothetical protein CMV_004324 [Castanea mollissima]|uniref:Uncharacterized protein n=1 Tax=Castanea mollissima TaxID=60419 RepID=A0A8J4RYG1_9ROSI|nr:hypothetical protein CMV_004324 [Castanea mollissima]